MSQSYHLPDPTRSLPTPPQQLDDASSPSSTGSQESVFSHVSSGSSASSQQSSNDNVQECRQSFNNSSEVKASDDIHYNTAGTVSHTPRLAVIDQPVPLDQRQNPRRSSSGLGEARRIPPLVRQDERKTLFVNDLVDSATTMVETIWPLSMSCGNRNVSRPSILPLRRYIEETLRRSRTSYSTLQVALYYLILIMPHVPKYDFTMEQPIDCPAIRALQCGRRMFLAALILASKYLQDRNYSAKAWSKMSGLKVSEINDNERSFLAAVQWKLHIPDHVFKRWTDIVLKYTVPPAPPAPGHGTSVPLTKNTLWKHAIPLLTPELDDHRLPLSADLPLPSTTSPTSVGCIAPPTPSRTELSTGHWASSSRESTPTPMNPPALDRLRPLQTPVMTPSSIASSTPAASTCSSRRPSISLAMAQSQNNHLYRNTDDRFPRACADLARYTGSRSSSLAPSASSTRSSPESMISDVSRSSRTSSISSASTALTCASDPDYLARHVMSQRSRLPSRQTSSDTVPKQSISRLRGGGAAEPSTAYDDGHLVECPDFSGCSINDDNTTPIFRVLAPTSVPNSAAGRKRARSRGRSLCEPHVQDSVRLLLRGDTPDDVDVTPKYDHYARSPREDQRSLPRLSYGSSDKNIQPPCSLRRESLGRLPVSKDSGRKRVCSSSHTSSHNTPMLYGEIR